MSWLDDVIMNRGDECGNCGAWRPLVNDHHEERRLITDCACGDEAVDIYAANDEEVPCVESNQCGIETSSVFLENVDG